MFSRPNNLNDIVGQEQVVNILKIICKAGEKDNRAFPHILLSGPPGLGKTSLALAIANQSNRNIQIVNGASINTIKDILPTIINSSDKDIIFIDEIHRLSSKVEEFLYPVLEDRRACLSADGDSSMQTPDLTFIGATTLSGALSKPFRDRFIYNLTLERYSDQEIEKILEAKIKQTDLTFSSSALQSLAGRCRGVPRLAQNYLTWVCTFSTASSITKVDDEVVLEAMDNILVDEYGITEQDRKYIRALMSAKRPLGLKTLSNIIDIDVETIEQVIEPYLLQLNVIQKTPKGRIINA